MQKLDRPLKHLHHLALHETHKNTSVELITWNLRSKITWNLKPIVTWNLKSTITWNLQSLVTWNIKPKVTWSENLKPIQPWRSYSERNKIHQITPQGPMQCLWYTSAYDGRGLGEKKLNEPAIHMLEMLNSWQVGHACRTTEVKIFDLNQQNKTSIFFLARGEVGGQGCFFVLFKKL